MEMDCSICHKTVDHSEAWIDYEKEEIFLVCARCEADRVDHLKTCSAERLLHLMRLCHPCEHGEPYGRWEVMEGVQKRAVEVFDSLKWPRNPEAVYKNRYTASEETLAKMFGERHWKTEYPLFEAWFIKNSWSILEHWMPIELFTEEDVFEEHKLNTPNKLTGYMTGSLKSSTITDDKIIDKKEKIMKLSNYN